jgi:hypothetical protein
VCCIKGDAVLPLHDLPAAAVNRQDPTGFTAKITLRYAEPAGFSGGRLQTQNVYSGVTLRMLLHTAQQLGEDQPREGSPNEGVNPKERDIAFCCAFLIKHAYE